MENTRPGPLAVAECRDSALRRSLNLPCPPHAGSCLCSSRSGTASLTRRVRGPGFLVNYEGELAAVMARVGRWRDRGLRRALGRAHEVRGHGACGVCPVLPSFGGGNVWFMML